jgi:hypothetical protein
VSTAAETPSASMAAASVWQWSMRPESTRQTWPARASRDHVLDDERVARRVARDGGEHRRVVLRAGVEVREVVSTLWMSGTVSTPAATSSSCVMVTSGAPRNRSSSAVSPSSRSGVAVSPSR